MSQDRQVRGSPIFSSLLLAIALLATAAGLARVTASKAPAPMPVAQDTGNSPADVTAIPYRLVLSAPAAEVTFDSAVSIKPSDDRSPLVGTLVLDSKNPAIGLTVKWKTPPPVGAHGFARLTLEPPGKDSITHVFDSSGDIEDFIELPISSVR